MQKHREENKSNLSIVNILLTQVFLKNHEHTIFRNKKFYWLSYVMI